MGLSLSVIVQAFVLFECWSKKSVNSGKKQVYLFLLKVMGISLVIGGILFITAVGLRSFIDHSGFLSSLTIAGIVGIEFLILFYLAGRVFKIAEIIIVYDNIFTRLFLWKTKSH